MRVPDLEAMIAVEEQQALPEIRLVNALYGYKYRSIGDETLLRFCHDAWGDSPEEQLLYRRPRPRYVETDSAGYKVYRAVVSILAGKYPGLGSWSIPDVQDAFTAYLESQRADS